MFISETSCDFVVPIALFPLLGLVQSFDQDAWFMGNQYTVHVTFVRTHVPVVSSRSSFEVGQT